MRFITIFSTLAVLSTLVAAAPVPVDSTQAATTAPTPVSALVSTTTTTRTPWALPTGGTTCVHCDPAFLRAVDDDDSEGAVLYRRACARSCA